MPTPTGLPKKGEVWEKRTRTRATSPTRARYSAVRFVVLERSRGDYWSLRVAIRTDQGYRKELFVDPAYWLEQGWLIYIGPAGPETKKRLGLA